jgi:hypothetical protein
VSIKKSSTKVHKVEKKLLSETLSSTPASKPVMSAIKKTKAVKSKLQTKVQSVPKQKSLPHAEYTSSPILGTQWGGWMDQCHDWLDCVMHSSTTAIKATQAVQERLQCNTEEAWNELANISRDFFQCATVIDWISLQERLQQLHQQRVTNEGIDLATMLQQSSAATAEPLLERITRFPKMCN